MDSIAISEQLGKTGLCVWPGFLLPQALRDVRADLEDIQAKGEFRRAGTGRGEGRDVRDLVRRDAVHWLERSPSSNATQSSLWSKLDSLKQALNRTLFLGLTSFEGHYATYAAGGFYRRHLDRFRAGDARVVSIVLYLNENWQPADGGKLRVYDSVSHTDVEPIGGTLVCFLSGESEHEVLTSHASRMSFTGWFKR